jgi:hypothetical protein
LFKAPQERQGPRTSLGKTNLPVISHLLTAFSITASFSPENSNLTYADLGCINAKKIMNGSAAFAAPGNQTMDNLIHLKDGQIVGDWRDSTYGIGGGRIPYDVNTALVPAALRAIASLARAGFFPTHLEWNQTADTYAQVWEDNTLQFFEVNISIAQATTLLSTYINSSSFNGSNQSDTLDSDVVFHALSLDGNNNQSQVQVMNTDDCFRHFLLNTTNQTQLTSFINSTANNVRRTFPAGLMTDVGMLISNPAYGPSPVYAANWTTSAYHGTVVWSWPLAMMARGLELQLSRCSSSSAPDFCSDSTVFNNVKNAYNILWDSIDANSAHLTTEVWSWTYSGGKFNFIDYGALPPPPGQSPTESDIVQLWSLTFLAVTKNEGFA